MPQSESSAIEPNPSIQISQRGVVGVVTLNRPARFNAITIPMMRRLYAALDELDGDDNIRCVVLAAEGRGFCAGQDLNVLHQFYGSHDPAELGDIIRREYNPVIERIATMRLPIIAAVGGVAAGAGWSLALACDLRIAGESATFVPGFAKLGLAPDLGGSSALVESIGLARAMEFALMTDRLSAVDAERIGLINRVVADNQLQPTAIEWAERIAAIPRDAVRLTKRGLRAAAALTTGGRLADEANDQAICASQPPHRDAVATFIGKS